MKEQSAENAGEPDVFKMNETIGKCECIYAPVKHTMVGVLHDEIRRTEENIENLKKGIERTDDEFIIDVLDDAIGMLKDTVLPKFEDTLKRVQATPDCT